MASIARNRPTAAEFSAAAEGRRSLLELGGASESGGSEPIPRSISSKHRGVGFDPRAAPGGGRSEYACAVILGKRTLSYETGYRTGERQEA